MKIAKRIIIVDGRLKMEDGSSLRKYLKKWQKKNPDLLPGGVYVNIIQHNALERLFDEAYLARNFGA